MKYALKSVPGLADVGVPHGDGPRTQFKVKTGLDLQGTDVLFYLDKQQHGFAVNPDLSEKAAYSAQRRFFIRSATVLWGFLQGIIK